MAQLIFKCLSTFISNTRTTKRVVWPVEQLRRKIYCFSLQNSCRILGSVIPF
jgi:hypothetical protein